MWAKTNSNCRSEGKQGRPRKRWTDEGEEDLKIKGLAARRIYKSFGIKGLMGIRNWYRVTRERKE